MSPWGVDAEMTFGWEPRLLRALSSDADAITVNANNDIDVTATTEGPNFATFNLAHLPSACYRP